MNIIKTNLKYSHTIYRIPTIDELKEVDSFNLNSEDIIKGLIYTIVGRGIKDKNNMNMILKSMEMLNRMYPNKNEYKITIDKFKDTYKIF